MLVAQNERRIAARGKLLTDGSSCACPPARPLPRTQEGAREGESPPTSLPQGHHLSRISEGVAAVAAAGGANKSTSSTDSDRLVCFFIPSQFLADAHRECSGPQDGHEAKVRACLAPPDKGGARRAALGVPWRNLLVSPLVNFLTEGRKVPEQWIPLPGSGGTIYKKTVAAEKAAYERLMEDDEAMRRFVPLFFKEVRASVHPYQ